MEQLIIVAVTVVVVAVVLAHRSLMLAVCELQRKSNEHVLAERARFSANSPEMEVARAGSQALAIVAGVAENASERMLALTEEGRQVLDMKQRLEAMRAAMEDAKADYARLMNVGAVPPARPHAPADNGDVTSIPASRWSGGDNPGAN